MIDAETNFEAMILDSLWFCDYKFFDDMLNLRNHT